MSFNNTYSVDSGKDGFLDSDPLSRLAVGAEVLQVVADDGVGVEALLGVAPGHRHRVPGGVHDDGLGRRPRQRHGVGSPSWLHFGVVGHVQPRGPEGLPAGAGRLAGVLAGIRRLEIWTSQDHDEIKKQWAASLEEWNLL